MQDNHTDTDSIRRQIARRISRTRLVIASERAARVFWPVWTFLLAVVAFVGFGGANLVNSWAPWPAILVVLIAGGLFGLGAARFRWPDRNDAALRLDLEGEGRPLATLDDRPAEEPTSAQRAVWEAHRRRAFERASEREVPPADLRVARQDPLALRLLAATACVAALLFVRGGDADPGALIGGGPAVAAGPAFEAWATPPGYTGAPTLYLTERAGEAAAIALPAGTEIVMRAYGDDFTLEETLSAAGNTPLTSLAPGLADASFTVEQGGRMSLRRGRSELASWTFTVDGDLSPTIRFDGEIARAQAGATEVPFAATDDYEVARAEMTVTLDLDAVDRRYGLAAEPMAREPLVVDLPLPARVVGQELTEIMVQDFSTHPFAAMPVQVHLTVYDGAEQSGRSETRELELPRRSFFDPLARAIVEQRRDLLWAPEENARRVSQVLRAVSYRPEELEVPSGAFLQLRTAIRALDAARDEGTVLDRTDEIAEQLWATALSIEDGRLADAAAALRRAQERLSQALEEGASDEEIAELMQELREAMQDYMRQMAEALQDNPEAQQRAEQSMENGMTMSQQDLQDLLDRIQELSEQGDRDEAQRLLDQLAQMMENMTMALNGQGQGEGQPGGPGEGGTPQEGVQDLLRQQQELADRSFEELQRQFREGMGQGQGQQGQQGQQQGTPSQPEGGPGGQGQGQQGLQGLAETQEALRRLLDELGEGLPGNGSRDALDEAEREMADSRDALQREDGRGALDSQAEAMESLRETLRQLDQETEANPSPNQGDVAAESGENGDARDPLGRPTANGRALDGEGEMVPDVGPLGSVQDLMDEIRRRSAEQDRPAEEREYLRRLLDRF
ncbi:TIGR02302 family protein [Pontivivens ytuae]|uniref:TIGR02302 family protein n=1 Tax=Pontivivens ytuae TaxID=2789856 RepID=A0A7S9QDJ1_9RHOB|nr:TIGR02302 family protein [Pontivivens ytuae]QPH55043.1 TIGR02302 family protein [Pontivivens ytuae]